MSLSPESIKEILGLQPHPTCGFVAETYRSKVQLPASALPGEFASPRPMGSVLYFLVTPDAQIRLHRIRNDQMYHHYLGEPLEVLLLYENGSSEIAVVGSDLTAGMRPQLFVPGRTFHVSRLRVAASYALLGTSEWPGVETPDVEVGDPESLSQEFPDRREAIAEFTGLRVQRA